MLLKIKAFEVHIKQLFLTLSCYLYDVYIFIVSTNLFFRKKNQRNVEANIRATIHSVERAFSLSQTRRPFGAKLLIGLAYWKSKLTVNKGSELHRKCNDGMNELSSWNAGLGDKPNSGDFGVVPFNDGTIRNGSRRRSVRHFSEEPLTNEIILKLIEEASHNAPSVCNRQTCRVYFVNENDKRNDILRLQNGNSGISGNFKLLVLTSDLSLFIDSSERNQWAIDGGIFAQSILNEAHNLNLGACPLNCSMSPSREKKVKKIISAKQSERLICMFSVGYISEDNCSAFSSRRSLSKVVQTL